MGLQAVQLDTLNWDQMVSAIRTRIYADSSKKWTLHAAVDPGVTLLELFAWLLDQRIYWMDQVPDSLVQAILALLGESPKPAQAAAALFQITDLATPPRLFPSVPAGMMLRLDETNPPLIFTLDQDLTLLPVGKIELRVDGVNRTNDLDQGRLVPLLSAGKSSAKISIVLPLTARIPPTASGQVFSLFFDLETPREIPRGWSVDAVSGVPPAATTSWWYQSTSNSTPIAFPQVDDGTAGLRRPGVVRLPIPADWQPDSPGTDPAIVSYTLILRIENANFTVVPRVANISPNIVRGQHRWQRTKNPKTKDWLPLPGNAVSLPDAPSDSSWKEFPPIEDTVHLHITERDGITHEDWKLVTDLSFSGPPDRVFFVDRVRSELRFGDGLTGRLPILAKANDFEIVVEYQAGGGTAGNVGENLGWHAIKEKDSDADPQFSARNIVRGDGGKESETLDETRQRAEAALKKRNRAITKTDYENLAQTTPGVGFRRAHAAIGYDPDFPCNAVPGAVTVFVVPYAPREKTDGDVAKGAYVPAPQPDPGALAAARMRLNDARLVGSEAFVRGPTYRSVWLEIDVASDSPLSPDLGKQIATRMQDFLDPLVGGDDGEGWPFGDPLRPSALVRESQKVLGDAGDVLRVSVRLNGMDTAESCQDVPIGPHELLTVVNVDVHAHRRAARRGGLR